MKKEINLKLSEIFVIQKNLILVDYSVTVASLETIGAARATHIRIPN